MGFRIQPHGVEVPEDDPFRNDRLSRQNSADALTHIISSLTGPCVLAVDAEWGNGKTTFVNMWSQKLRNQGFVVAHFNAWETDYCRDPFTALTTELTDSLPREASEELSNHILRFTEAAQKVMLGVVSETVRRATGDLVDPSAIIEMMGSEAEYSQTEPRVAAYRAGKRSRIEFKQRLRDLARLLSESHASHPIVIVIDELDRCRPAYAVELLEVSKHLFDVNHIVFVLSVNQKELAHSVEAIYGADFDALGYLRRFFDMDFRLPNADRDALIDAMLSTIEIEGASGRGPARTDSENLKLVKNMLRTFLSTEHFSVRDVEQAMRRLGLVLASLPNGKNAFVAPASVALVLRSFDLDAYQGFIQGQLSDMEVMDCILNKPGMKSLKPYRQREDTVQFDAIAFLEAGIVSAGFELAQREMSHTSPIMNGYREDTGADQFFQVPNDKCYSREGIILRMINHYRRVNPGFKESVDRIELVSSNFVL